MPVLNVSSVTVRVNPFSMNPPSSRKGAFLSACSVSLFFFFLLGSLLLTRQGTHPYMATASPQSTAVRSCDPLHLSYNRAPYILVALLASTSLSLLSNPSQPAPRQCHSRVLLQQPCLPYLSGACTERESPAASPLSRFLAKPEGRLHHRFYQVRSKKGVKSTVYLLSTS